MDYRMNSSEKREEGGCNFEPYTVVDVLTKVYGRSFQKDLEAYVNESRYYCPSGSQYRDLIQFSVTSCRVLRVESLYFQPLHEYRVEIMTEVTSKGTYLMPDGERVVTEYLRPRKIWLAYELNLVPYKGKCKFCGIITREKETMLARCPNEIRADKYWIPILKESDIRLWRRSSFEDIIRLLKKMKFPMRRCWQSRCICTYWTAIFRMGT